MCSSDLETAAVRIAVIGLAFITASVSPVSPSKSVTVPWWGSSPRAALSGKTHRVLTAVALQTRAGLSTVVSQTEVTFREITDAEQLRYWNTGEPLGKAGGYAVQGLAAAFITRIEGSYSGVMGLPLAETAALLSAAGISIWQTGATA